MTRLMLAFLLVLFTARLPIGASAQAADIASQNSALAEADQLLASGKFAEAADRYQALVKADPSSVPAQVGLVRALLIDAKLDEAFAAANSALVVQPNALLLVTTMAEVQFRLGKIADAEKSYLKAQKLSPNDAVPYLGLWQVYRSYSLYRRAYDEIKRAHDLAPNDAVVQLLWFNSLPQSERIPAVEAFLAGPAGQSLQVAQQLQQYLEQLKKTAGAPVHPCKLVSSVEQTNTKLLAVPRAGMQLGASGLAVKLDNQELHLALDTGASGILIGHLAAQKAGLKALASQSIGGVGDTGQQAGYLAVADRIRIGALEFQDCLVRVTEADTPVSGQDGLIGTDVFSSYLIDIDIPGAKLRLSPLPKRPDEISAPAALKTGVAGRDSQELDSEAPTDTANNPPGTANLSKDAYVAPEMSNWTKVYRFNYILLVPTLVDGTGPMLFMMDTGSFSNVLSTRAAREVTQVRSDPAMQVKGLSGNVANVYLADKAALQFGRYEQKNQDIVTFDLSTICKQTGTDVSGILGYAMLRILQIKIDYRDGLVDFIYDPKHLPKQIRIK